jgi:hypothetical protein
MPSATVRAVPEVWAVRRRGERAPLAARREHRDTLPRWRTGAAEASIATSLMAFDASPLAFVKRVNVEVAGS